MALTNTPVFTQGSRSVNVSLATANTALDGTGTITTLLTAGANGSLVTHLHIVSGATTTATAVRFFLSNDGGSTWVYFYPALHAAFTVANTTAQTPTTVVDRNNPDGAIRLAANAVLGFTEAVANSIRVYAEVVDF